MFKILKENWKVVLIVSIALLFFAVGMIMCD